MKLSEKLNPLPDLEDDTVFKDIVKEYTEKSYFSENDFVVRFGVARSTITRYKSGVTSPHRAMRRPMYNYIAEVARNNND